GSRHPRKVAGIQVGGRVSRLFILHATHWSARTKNALVGHYIVNYVDQSRETIALVQNKDLGNWWVMNCEGPNRAEVAWKGTNEDPRRTCNTTIALYLTRWQNPEPTRTVVSIDFTTTNSAAAPFCVAMTVEDCP